METNGQSAAVAAQYRLSGQQYQLSLGRHPAGQDVSRSPHCLLAAILESFVFMETNEQSAAVAAQYRLSGQQYQFSLGQHPAGQDVSCSPHCFLAAILESLAFMETNGQSAAVAAQYRLSGQQYQFSFGQHPAGQDVSCSPHCLLAAILESFV